MLYNIFFNYMVCYIIVLLSFKANGNQSHFVSNPKIF